MNDARLIVAASEHDANLLYATRFFAPDPFIYFEVAGRKYVVMNDLEIDRARREAQVDRVLSWTFYVRRLKNEGVKTPRLADVLRCVLADFKVRQVTVPHSFPVGLAKRLRGLRVQVAAEPFHPARTVKTPAEVRHLERALWLAEEGMRAAVNVLRMSRIGRDGYLYWRGDKLTSEHMQGVINATIAGLGGTASRTIVAGGNQGCDPHEVGHGPLRAHQTIILDIFPRDNTTGYWGDITRTVVRGRASDAVKKLYALVGQGQQIAFDRLRDGVDGQDIHNAIQAHFRANGCPTRRHRGRMEGFFHGTGHGLGLEIHESPRVGAVAEKLQAGQVVTVEPGLYYPGTGGVRLEDVAVIGKRGARNLTVFPKHFEL
jgi:Xaa-Pro aminopeptidase